MTNELSKLEQQIQKFMPFNEQEEHDKAILLKWFESGSDILTRENEIARSRTGCGQLLYSDHSAFAKSS